MVPFRIALATALVLATASLAACADPDSDEPTVVDSANTVSLALDSQGGQLRGPELGPLAGFVVDVPASAIAASESVVLTMRAVVDPTELPPAAYRVGPMVEITASAALATAATLTAPTFREDVHAYGQESLQVKVWRRASDAYAVDEWLKLDGLSFSDDSVTVLVDLGDDPVVIAAGVKLDDAACSDCEVVEVADSCTGASSPCASWATSQAPSLIADAIAVDDNAAYLVGVTSDSLGFADRIALSDGGVTRIATAPVDDPWAILRTRRIAADGAGGVIATDITGAVHFDASGVWSMESAMHAYSAGLTDMADGRVALLTYDGDVSVHTYSGLGWVLTEATFDITPGPASVFHASPDGAARTGALWAVSDAFGDELIHADLAAGAAIRSVTSLPCAARDVVSLASGEAGLVVVCGADRRAYQLEDEALVSAPALDGLSELTSLGSDWAGVSPADGAIRRVTPKGDIQSYRLMAGESSLTPTALAASPTGDLFVLASGRLVKLGL